MNHMACRNQLLQCMYLIYVCIVPTIIYVQYVLYACMHGCIHVCMCACMYIYMYACMHLCMKFMYKLFACMHVWREFLYMHVCMHSCTFLPFYLCILVGLYALYIQLLACQYVCMDAYRLHPLHQWPKDSHQQCVGVSSGLRLDCFTSIMLWCMNFQVLLAFHHTCIQDSLYI